MALFSNRSFEGIREAFQDMTAKVDSLEHKHEMIQESVGAGGGINALRAEDIGWRLISGGANTGTDEIDPVVLQQHSQQARMLSAYNPLVKRGVVVRNAYIWESEITYPETAKTIVEKAVNQKHFFGQEAREELEKAFCTDGQYYVLVSKGKKTIHRIPMWEITNSVSNPDHASDIEYYLRTYHRTVTDIETGKSTTEKVEKWHPSITFDGPYKSSINKIPVDKTSRIEHATVNGATGWRYGLPDLLGAVYWARAYKEYLEASYTLAKSLARLAFKVSNESNKGTKAVAASLARPVPRNEAGSTVSLGSGQDLQAINKSGSNVDFGAGSPLAAMVAASLDIPLSVVLTDGSAGGRQGAENALEDPTIKSMNRRRRTHLDSRIRVLEYLGVKEEPTWNDLDGALLHRRLQSIQIGVDTKTLHPEEIRNEVIRTLGIVTDKSNDDIPEDFYAEPVPFGGEPAGDGEDKDDKTGPLSDGTNDSRDNPGGATDA